MTEQLFEKSSKTKSAKKMMNLKLSKYAFIVPMIFYPMVLFIIFWGGVNIKSIFMAFENRALDGTTTFAGLDNIKGFIRQLFSDSEILGIAFKNTLKFYAIDYLITLPANFILAYYIFKKFPFFRIYTALCMLPSVVSGFIYGLIFKQMVGTGVPGIWSMITGKSIENFPNLLMHPDYAFGTNVFYIIWLGFTSIIVIYPNAMRAISPELFEAARMDGCGLWREFWNIIYPLIFPTFSSYLVMGVAGFFTTSGVAMNFYMWSAPQEVYFVGYYFSQKLMTATNDTVYPFLAAGGLVLTVIAAPITFLVKWLLEKYGPSVD